MNTISHIPKIQYVSDPQGLENFRQGLKPGTEISGRVLQSFDNNQYLVSMRGMNLIAQSDIPLKNGERFKAKIQSSEPRIVLKISDQSSEAQKLAGQWNVKGDDKHIVSEMMSARMEMNKDVFERIRGVVQKFKGHPQLQGSPQDLAHAAVKLEQLNLPPTLENMKGALLAGKGNFDLAAVLGNLNFFNGEDAPEISADLKRFIQNLPMRFDPQMLSRNLPAAVTLLGILHEAGLKDLLLGKIPKKVNLKWLMLALEKGFPELTQQKSGGVSDIEAMQLRNLPQSRSAEGDSTYLQLPVYYQGEWERMDVFFRDHSGGGKKMDKNNASIRISLDTRYLGKMSSFTDIQNGALTINLSFEKEEIVDFIRPFTSELKEALDNIGYNVRGLTVSIFKPDSIEEVEQQIRTISNHSLNLIA